MKHKRAPIHQQNAAAPADAPIGPQGVAESGHSAFCAPRSAFRPGLFWVMLAAFALVIVLGIGGMASFFGLAMMGTWQEWGNTDRPGHMQQSPYGVSYMPPNEWALLIGERYAARGSWAGALHELPAPPASVGYALADEQGRVVATNVEQYRVGQLLGTRELRRATPILARGPVGTLVVGFNTAYAERLRRGLLGAGLGLSAVLLLLAAIFSRRISKPLLQITRASEAVAGGDLTARVQGNRIRELDALAGSFNRMADSLVQADQQRRQLTADVAHELRTPLSIIKGRLEGIQDGVYNPTPDQIEGLLEETALLERLVEDLRLLALSEAGQLQLYLESAEPALLLEDAADNFVQQAVARGVALEVVAPPDLPEVQVDPQRIAQVLSNLVGNALRYTPPGGNVTLCVTPALVEENLPKITFTVRDSGKGIAPEDLPHIFDRFWRADRSRTRASGGTGLGLAIARQIVEAHGGRIWASSNVGQGTTVSFTLPVQTTAAEAHIGG